MNPALMKSYGDERVRGIHYEHPEVAPTHFERRLWRFREESARRSRRLGIAISQQNITKSWRGIPLITPASNVVDSPSICVLCSLFLSSTTPANAHISSVDQETYKLGTIYQYHFIL
jgi:hypothetical protein